MKETYVMKHGAGASKQGGRHLAPDPRAAARHGRPAEPEARTEPAGTVRIREVPAEIPEIPASQIPDARPETPETPAERRRRSALRRTGPFFTTLALVTILAWILPLRPTVAEEEKRNLTPPPEFSVQNLLDGTFFRQTESWFSDTFTGRSMWVRAAQRVRGLYGWNDVVIYGTGPKADEVPVESAEPAAPETSPHTPEDEAQVQTSPGKDPGAGVTPDADPAVSPTPTPWGGDSIGEGEYLNTVGMLIQIGDTAYEWPGFDRSAADGYIEQMNRAGALLEGRAHVYSIIAPLSTSVMLSREFREETLDCTLEEDALTYLESGMTNSNVTPVRIIDALIAHNSEYIYFRTDHHWTALGAYYAYLEWCIAAGERPVPLSAYTPIDMGPYLGTYYEASNQADLLSANKDNVIAYDPPGDLSLYITDYAEDTPEYYGELTPVLWDEREAEVWFKYATFLAGDHAFCVLVNDAIQDDSACLVYKNSMGNPFVYYLTQHYHTVYVCDYRYYETRNLSDFVDTYKVQDVIFLNNTMQAEWWGSVELVAQQIGYYDDED